MEGEKCFHSWLMSRLMLLFPTIIIQYHRVRTQALSVSETSSTSSFLHLLKSSQTLYHWALGHLRRRRLRSAAEVQMVSISPMEGPEIFSFGAKGSELSALYPVKTFDTSEIADMPESKLKSPICLVALIWMKCSSAAYLSTNKYLVALCFGSALPVFRWKQQERDKMKGKLFVFPWRKQSLKLRVTCGEGWRQTSGNHGLIRLPQYENISETELRM